METRIYILLVLFASARSTQWTDKLIPVQQCMQLVQREPKITGGAEAPLHAFPYQAAVYFDSKTIYGGVLITDSWVITTAYAATIKPTKPLVILGVQKIDDSEFSEQRIQSDEIITHELYTNYFTNNIALLHLDRKAELNIYVSTIMLAPYNAPDFTGSHLLMSGYGYTVDGPNRILHYVMVDGISNSDCRKVHGDKINDGNLCIETTGGKGACNLDSGGPLVDINSGLLVGLTAVYDTMYTSGHGAHVRSCAQGIPQIFTRVSQYNKWIADKLIGK